MTRYDIFCVITKKHMKYMIMMEQKPKKNYVKN